jgi:hypothetical protein
MKNSFILKNSGPKFDAYYTALKKRKGGYNPTMGEKNNTSFMNNSMEKDGGCKYGKIGGKRPAARDGHSQACFGESLVIFGGDRHHMPFNDLFCLDLKEEIQSKSFLFNTGLHI